MLHTSTNQLAIFIATVFIAGAAHSTCVIPPFDTPLEDQLALLPECQRNAAYLAQIGRLLNAQRRYLDALDHLERALMFDPDLQGAQLDYAIALAGSGDLLSARQLLDTIIAQPDLSPEMRQTLVQTQQRMAQQAAGAAPDGAEGPFTLHLGANIRSGQDSNLLGAPSLSSLELTFPGEVVVLPLTDSNNPRPGAYTRADAKLELGYQTAAGNRWDLAANLMQRNSAAVPESDTRQSELVLEYNPTLANGWATYASASRVQLSTESGTQYASQGVAVGLQSSAVVLESRSLCSARGGVEWQTRQLASNPILSGHYTGLAALWSCSTAGGGQWQVFAKTGQDRPTEPDRPGGDQNVASVRAVASTAALLLDLELSHTHDTVGYSALLDNSAVRHTSRFNARVEYQRPLGAKVLGTLGAEWSYQDSNLPLFRVRSWGPYAAVKLVW